MHARRHALRPDILDLDLSTLEASPARREATLERPWDERLLDEVPASSVAASPWQVCMLGEFHTQEDIMRKEGRALVMAIRHLLRTRSNRHRHSLFLVDNLALALAVAKGRSGSPWLLSTCREITALSLFSGSRFHVRWLPSEVNPADAPSRGRRAALRISIPELKLAHVDLAHDWAAEA